MRDVLRPLGLKPSPTVMGGFSEQSRHSVDFGCVGICSLRMVRVCSPARGKFALPAWQSPQSATPPAPLAKGSLRLLTSPVSKELHIKLHKHTLLPQSRGVEQIKRCIIIKTPIAGVFSMMNYSVTSGRVTVVFPKPSKVRVTVPAKERPSASFSVRAEKT